MADKTLNAILFPLVLFSLSVYGLLHMHSAVYIPGRCKILGLGDECQEDVICMHGVMLSVAERRLRVDSSS